MSNRSEYTVWSDTYIAEAAVTKNGFVIRGTGAHQCDLPAATGVQTLGVALDDAAAGEEVEVGIIGRFWVIDMDGTLNNGDLVCTGDGAAEYHKAILATTSDLTAGVVDGTDGAAADDLVLVRIGAGYGHDAA
jgi:hypothetical protein